MKFIAIIAFLLFGCTEQERTVDITCYSGGAVVWRGYALGRVDVTDGATRFNDVDGKRHKISGNCVVVYGEPND